MDDLEIEQYRKADELALQIRIDYKLFDKELDVFKLCEYLRINLVKYSQLSKQINNLLIKECKLNDALALIKNSSNFKITNYLIYNDEICLVRQRFSISHEIWHIVNPKITEGPYDEKIADHFARSLLAPRCLIINGRYTDSLKIASDFNISLNAANNAFISANNWARHPKFEYTEKEKEFLRNYKK